MDTERQSPRSDAGRPDTAAFYDIVSKVAALPKQERWSAKDRVRRAVAKLGRKLTACDRAVAEALLEKVNWKHGYAYPGTAWLIQETGFCRRAVFQSKRKLALLGLITTKVVSSSVGEPEPLRVTFPDLVQQNALPSAEACMTGGAEVCTGVMQKITPKPIEDNQLNITSAAPSFAAPPETGRQHTAPCASQRSTVATNCSNSQGMDLASDTHFDAFWTAYPRKRAKAAARKAWSKLSGDQHARALEAVPRFVAQLRRDKTEDRFIPYPATWLNTERFEDEVGTAAAAPRSGRSTPIDILNRAAERYIDTGFWDPQLGPEPGQPGSDVSSDMLARLHAGDGVIDLEARRHANR